jgi:hypothetical protein
MKGGIRCGLGKGAQLSCLRSLVAAYVSIIENYLLQAVLELY